MTPRKPRAVGYTRVSTTEQTTGFGLEVQQDSLRRWAADTGHRLVAVETDEGESGSNGLDSRRGLAAALALIEAGEAEVLAVYRMDRLARDLVLQETLVERLQQASSRVVSVTEPDLDGEEPTRVLIRQVLGALSQYERAVIRGRMLAGKAAKKARGGYAGGQPAYGLKAEDRALVSDDAEGDLVQRVKDLRDGGASYRAICDRLTEEGYRPRRAQQWQPMVVRRIALRGS